MDGGTFVHINNEINNTSNGSFTHQRQNSVKTVTSRQHTAAPTEKKPSLDLFQPQPPPPHHSQLVVVAFQALGVADATHIGVVLGCVAVDLGLPLIVAVVLSYSAQRVVVGPIAAATAHHR